MIAGRLRPWLLLAATIFALSAPLAHGAIYLTGSVTASQSNAGLQTHSSNGGSATIASDLGRYVRLGYTHRQDIQRSKGYVGETEDDCDFSKEDSLARCLDYDSNTHIMSNSVDLTLILYEGDVFVPFLMGGAVVKTYTYQSSKAGEIVTKVGPKSTPPLPNLGIGMGIRLNREFSLKLSYTASPGYVYTPDGKSRSAWDKNTSLGLTYQL